MYVALLAAPQARGEVIDRVAVSVGNRIITASQLDREIRVTAFLNGEPPDFSPAARRAAADRLVDQTLIRREMDTTGYPQPPEADAAPILDQFQKEHFASGAEYRQALAASGLSERDLDEEILWQRRLLQFVGVRFGEGAPVSDEEIANYFEQTVRPAAQAAHPGQPATLDQYRAAIEERLAAPRVDAALDAWLEDVRARTEIVYHEEAFQ
jgi:hypothetical protein